MCCSHAPLALRTVGSTEACLLSGLALKFRWRHWYRKRHNMTEAEVRGVYPNVVMSSAYQVCVARVLCGRQVGVMSALYG